MVEEYYFCLYVAGKDAPNSFRAINNLEKLFQSYLSVPYRLEVVDVITNPDRAESDRITATPTLLWRIGEQRGRIIGDFTNKEKIISLLRGI